MPKGRYPKPTHLRQRRNKKAGATTLLAPDTEQGEKTKLPPLQNPDKRKWHKLTRSWWEHVWQSPMAGEYLPTDVDGLARLAILVDNYYNSASKELLTEIRLQEARFGLSPVDRFRLGWNVLKGEEAERKRNWEQQRQRIISERDPERDPRDFLR